jgi:uncharacterized Zn finger protein
MTPPAKGAIRRGFGQTWWGRAWVEALEQRASLDPNRLPRGRTYARRGTVGDLTVRAGEVRAAVRGSRARPYDVRVRVRTYTPEEWDQVVEALAGRLGHTAALIDGELPPEVAEELRAAGLDPLPGAGEVQPRCSCPDWADPCKHAAAVCYLVAEALDEDPFLLFEIRGRSRPELLAALRARRGEPAARMEPVDEMQGWGKDTGMLARDAWARLPAPLPSTPLPPRAPGRPTVLGTDPPPTTGLSADALRSLAADAAHRAWALSQGATSSGLELTADEDLARHAAAGVRGPDDGPPDAPEHIGIDELGRRAGVPARVLLRWALAWRDGGPAGLAALRDSTPADPDALEAARAALGPDATTWRNRVTAGDRQLRIGTDGRWYPFRRATATTWDPDGPPLDH